MKLSLTVLSAGSSQGKTIPIGLPQFVIGRGPQCHLRPANPIISKRHCALIIRDEGVFVRDFESTNGTFVNKVAVKGEHVLKNDDCLEVGPLAFRVHIEQPAPVNEPTPLPPSKPGSPVSRGSKADDEAADLLLAMHDDSSAGDTEDLGGTAHEPSTNGSTVVEEAKDLETSSNPSAKSGGAERHEAAKAAAADTSAAAKVLLDKYIRRPRDLK
jgi:predicted component of type VI protein secretion system